jgi:hypothetical protein
MSGNDEKVFINGIFVREFKFENGGSVLNLSLRVADVIEELQKHEKSNGFAQFKIHSKREENVKQGGTTHYVALDPYEPKVESRVEKKAQQQDEDLPF